LWYTSLLLYQEVIVMRRTPTETSEAAIFARLFEGRNGHLTQAVARKLLAITFTETDQARMEELAQRNQQGRLMAQEREELANYVKVGDLLAILHSKARQALKKHQTSPHA
jgi:hypothetical protein